MRRVSWFARGAGIARSGPYKSQVAATEALRLEGGGFPSDAFVWPEPAKAKTKKR